MADVKQISDAEWEVIKVLWAGGAMTAGQVVERVAAGRKWHARTVKTLLGRLVRKGAVSAQADGNRYIYRARVSRASCQRRESRSFIDRVFDGAVAPAVAHFLEQAELSAREIDQLKRILDKERP